MEFFKQKKTKNKPPLIDSARKDEDPLKISSPLFATSNSEQFQNLSYVGPPSTSFNNQGETEGMRRQLSMSSTNSSLSDLRTVRSNPNQDTNSIMSFDNSSTFSSNPGVGGYNDGILEELFEQLMSQNRVDGRLDKTTPEFFVQKMKEYDCNLMPLKNFTYLRVSLTTQPISWVKQFVYLQGLKMLTDALAVLNRRSTKREGDNNIEHEIIKCMKALLNTRVGSKEALENPKCIYNLVFSIDSKYITTRRLVSESLVYICCSEEAIGHANVLEGMEKLCKFRNQSIRFEAWMQVFEATLLGRGQMGSKVGASEEFKSLVGADKELLDYALSNIMLVNALIEIPEELEVRMHVRHQLNQCGLGRILKLLQGLGSELIDLQVRKFERVGEMDEAELIESYNSHILQNMNDPRDVFEALLKSVEGIRAKDYFLSMLQHLLLIRYDNDLKTRYYQVIDSVVTNIVLDQHYFDSGHAKELPSVITTITRFEKEDELNLAIKETQDIKKQLSDTLKRKNELEIELTMKQGDVVVELKNKNASLENLLKMSRQTIEALQNQYKEIYYQLDHKLSSQDEQLKQVYGVLQNETGEKSGFNPALEIENKLLKTGRYFKADEEGHLYLDKEKLETDVKRKMASNQRKRKENRTASIISEKDQFDDLSRISIKKSTSRLRSEPSSPKPEDTQPIPAPPPPPPPAPGVGPPPPPGAPVPPGMVVQDKKELSIKANVKMKQLQWEKINFNKIKNTIWEQINTVDFDYKWIEAFKSINVFKELEARFAAKIVKPNSQKYGNKMGTGQEIELEKDKKTLIEPKRSYNINIMIGRLKHLTFQQLASAIVNVNTNIVNEILTKQLLNFVPTDDERELLEQHMDEYNDLAKVEQFFIEIMKIYRYEAKLKSIYFMLSFDDQYTDIEQAITSVLKGSQLLIEHAKGEFKNFLELILIVGNFMNGSGFRGGAFGFKVSSLTKLADTRSDPPEGERVQLELPNTLLNYLLEFMDTNYPNLLNLLKDIKHIEPAGKVSFNDLMVDFQDMGNQLQMTQVELRDHYQSYGTEENTYVMTIKGFIEKTSIKYQDLQSKYAKMMSLYDQCLLLFSEDSASVGPDEFFAYFRQFDQLVRKARSQNKAEKDRLNRIERQKLQQQQQSRRPSETQIQSSGIKNRKSTINDETVGVMDKLLDSLKSGADFNRNRSRLKDKAVRSSSIGLKAMKMLEEINLDD